VHRIDSVVFDFRVNLGNRDIAVSGDLRGFHGGVGVRLGDVCAAIDDHLSEAGYAQFSRPPFIRRRGHGLGSGSTAPGDVSVDNDALLEPGMLFMVHPNQFLPETGYMMCGEPVVVTQDGFEILTQETAALATAKGFAS
jgi:Xaa-Pro aminopeptidase